MDCKLKNFIKVIKKPKIYFLFYIFPIKPLSLLKGIKSYYFFIPILIHFPWLGEVTDKE